MSVTRIKAWRSSPRLSRWRETLIAILHGDVTPGMPSKCELVQCRLTLFYDYWSMNELQESQKEHYPLSLIAILDLCHVDRHMILPSLRLSFLRLEYELNHRVEQVVIVGSLLKVKTLHPGYQGIRSILDELLPKGVIVPSAFETVGHIAHLNLRDEHLRYKELIARVVLDKNRPKIQTVVNKIDAIQNDYRTMQLEVLAGNHSLVTTVVENGIRFHVNLATVYWNSRLATERQRLIYSFTSKDVICDVFAGVGPIAISAAKKVKYVYANDLNPNAIEYLERNIVLNKLERKIEVFNMDGRRFIYSIFASQQPHSITQVVMNLPIDAAEFLDAFIGVFKRRCRDTVYALPKVHVYGFSKSQDPEFDFCERIKLALCESVIDIETHRVRLVAPGKWMLCGSFVLPETVAFARQTQPYE